MNLWQSMATRMRALLTRPETPSTSRVVHVGRTTGGEFISADTALKQSAVWACLAYLSRTVAQLPWRVLIDSDGAREELRTHPVSRLLRVRPNPEFGPFQFKETLVWWAASWGNAVAEIQFDQRGVPVGLWPIHPSRGEFVRDADSGELRYRVWNERGPMAELAPSQYFHLRGFGEGPVGQNVIAYAAESIGWARATEVFGAAYFGQGMTPSGIVKTKGKLTTDALKVLKDELKDVYAGAKNAHKTFVLDVDMDYEQLAVDPVNAQLVETRQHQVEEICRWFGVPPHKVMHLLRATFSNIEHQSIEVVVDSITPWALRLEQEADFKLFGSNRLGLYTKLDLKGLLRGDYKSRQEGLQIMRRNGVISADEWRALEDLNPIGEGRGGDLYTIEANMTRLERVGEAPAQATARPVEPPADPTPADRARQQRARANGKAVH